MLFPMAREVAHNIPVHIHVSDIWYLVPALLASVDGIVSELLDAGVTLANVDVEVDTSEGDTVDCWMGDKSE